MKPLILSAVIGAVIAFILAIIFHWREESILLGAVLGPVILYGIYIAAFAFGVGRTTAKHRHHYRNHRD